MYKQNHPGYDDADPNIICTSVVWSKSQATSAGCCFSFTRSQTQCTDSWFLESQTWNELQHPKIHKTAPFDWQLHDNTKAANKHASHYTPWNLANILQKWTVQPRISKPGPTRHLVPTNRIPHKLEIELCFKASCPVKVQAWSSFRCWHNTWELLIGSLTESYV